MGGMRKIVAILVADVVGYSRLAGGGRRSHTIQALIRTHGPNCEGRWT